MLTFPNASLAVGDVLYDTRQPFYNVHNGQFYSYLMYIIFQPSSCDGTVAGFLAVSFSNDGVNWWSDANLQNMLARRIGGPTFPCFAASNTVPVIAFSAVLDNANGVIDALGMEGDVSLITNPQNFSTTQTYLGQASISDPTLFTVLGAVSGANLTLPNAAGCSSYKYFLSVDTAYEPATGLFYATRDYPYPVDLAAQQPGATTPCMSTCPAGIQTYTNRAQTYSMLLPQGSLTNVPYLLSGSWQLVNDVGAPRGYSALQGGCTGGGACVDTLLVPPQQSIGMSAGPMTIRRKGDGSMAYTPALGSSSLEFEVIGTSNYDVTCSTLAGAYETQPRQVLQATSFGPRYQGYLDSVDCSTRMVGWAWDASMPAATANVEVYDGTVLLGTYPANVYRSDLQAAGIGDGRHGFDVTLPARTDGQNHLLHAVVAGTSVELNSSPRSVTCPAAPPVISSLSPASGTTAGGDLVTINGSGFAPGATVSVGGASGSQVTVVSSTQITFRTVPHAPGAVTVLVSSPGGGTSSPGVTFTYLASATQFYTITACRILDTRNANGPLGGPSLAAGQTRMFAVAGVCGIPSSARTVSANYTVVAPANLGSLTILPGGDPASQATSISFKQGVTRANNGLMTLSWSGSGTVSVTNNSSTSTDFIIDANGYFR